MLVLRLHGAKGGAFDSDGFGIALKVCDNGICAAFAGDAQIRAGPKQADRPRRIAVAQRVDNAPYESFYGGPIPSNGIK